MVHSNDQFLKAGISSDMKASILVQMLFKFSSSLRRTSLGGDHEVCELSSRFQGLMRLALHCVFETRLNVANLALHRARTLRVIYMCPGRGRRERLMKQI